jgi:RNA recognition motif-containing protein
MPKKIFIGDLGVSTTESTLNTEFSPYGTIVALTLNTNPSGGPNTADCEYTTDAAGTAAIAAKNGTRIDGSVITVTAAPS